MTWSLDNSQCYESAKCRWDVARYTRGLGLDVGCGPEKCYPHMIGVDSDVDRHLFGKHAAYDVQVPDASNLPLFATQSMDFVFSSHLLEHIVDYKKALAEWWRIVKVGGHLVLYLPHKDHYPNRGHIHANPDHKHDFVNQDIIDAMTELGGWDLMVDEVRTKDEEYSFLQVYQKRSDRQHKWTCHLRKPNKTAAVVRYGAWGDALQASSVVEMLKQEGYHITFYCTPRAYEVIKLDPNIDDFYIQGDDQIPNAALKWFWEWESRKYTKWVNLSQTVEDTWLTLGDKVSAGWPKKLRDKLYNYNYVQFMHEVADVPYARPLVKFYPSSEERKWAEKKRRKWGGDPFIVFALSGSSVHKVWPHMDGFIARVFLHYPRARIVFVGGPGDAILEDPWRKEPRVTCTCEDALSIRESLALAQVADFVIGPETGVLNAVSCERMPKIVLLSHSSHENLTRDWVNTSAVFSTMTACYPCHKMHYSFETCTRDEALGTAQCQSDIPTDAVWAAFQQIMRKAA